MTLHVQEQSGISPFNCWWYGLACVQVPLFIKLQRPNEMFGEGVGGAQNVSKSFPEESAVSGNHKEKPGIKITSAVTPED